MINELLLQSLSKYYHNNDHIEVLQSILNNQNKISLRLIDWFTTNYSKKHNIMYLIYTNQDGGKTLQETKDVLSQFNVYNSYKSQLKAYSKKQFDPFCRRERYKFTCKGVTIDTTIGQLNFFKWIINNNIIDYIKQNMYDIENDMNYSLKNIKNTYQKKNNIRKPRQELSKSALRGLNKIPLKVSIYFD
jgi:hypothetical protein